MSIFHGNRMAGQRVVLLGNKRTLHRSDGMSAKQGRTVRDTTAATSKCRAALAAGNDVLAQRCATDVAHNTSWADQQKQGTGNRASRRRLVPAPLESHVCTSYLVRSSRLHHPQAAF
jgi:hypothetical protein